MRFVLGDLGTESSSYSYILKIRGSVQKNESSVRSVMLYGAETWQMKEEIENILKRCDRRMLRYMAIHLTPARLE